MEIEKLSQSPGAEPTVHAVAKPLTRMVTWAGVAACTAALTAAAVRTVRHGD